jgi:hypothetical protein
MAEILKLRSTETASVSSGGAKVLFYYVISKRVHKIKIWA